jgi:hypothetical protein
MCHMTSPTCRSPQALQVSFITTLINIVYIKILVYIHDNKFHLRDVH